MKKLNRISKNFSKSLTIRTTSSIRKEKVIIIRLKYLRTYTSKSLRITRKISKPSLSFSKIAEKLKKSLRN